MSDERRITAQDASGWNAMNELALDFADGVIREVALQAGEHVDSDGVLRYDGYPRLLVHVQMQGAGGTSIALEFAGVRSFAYDYDLDVTPAHASSSDGGTWQVRLLGLRVTATECTARLMGPSGLGEGPFVLRG